MDITRSVVSERDRALLGGDYTNYHAQATRRIHAIRKRLGTTTPRGRKYTPKATVTVENVAQNVEWVQLLLASSERSWASAMEMKSSQSTETTQKPMAGSTKRQIASRLHRAVTHAENLVNVLRDHTTTKANDTDILEAKAYVALMRGGLDFEKTRWKSCLQNYSIARTIYVALSSSVKSDIYKDLLSNTVDPSIRYAAYQLKLPRTKPVTEIALESFPNTESGVETRSEIEGVDSQAFQPPSERITTNKEGSKDLPSTITWRNRTVKLEDAAIAQALGLASEREKTLLSSFQSFQDGSLDSKQLASSYDDVINARQDAVDATKTAIDELAAEGIEAGDSRMQSLQVTRTAVSYGVIEWRVGRTRVLCGSQDGLIFEPESPKPSRRQKKDDKTQIPKEESTRRRLARLRERVALYDSVLQSIDAVKDLPGVIADTEFVADLDMKRSYFRALKCLAIGRSHSIKDSISDALALYSRAFDLSQQRGKASSPGESVGSDTPLKFEVTDRDSGSLGKHLTSLVTQNRALVELKRIQRSSATTGKDKADYKAPLVERLLQNQYEDDVDLTNLVVFPPKLQPIPVKPLFFDLAWNYIQYPGKQVDGATNGEAVKDMSKKGGETETSQPAKKGWFGFGR